MGGSKYVGHLSIQKSGQNMKVVRPDGQIIQGPQLIQGPLDHCIVYSTTYPGLCLDRYIRRNWVTPPTQPRVR